jgi:hypothetical protein
VSGFIQDLRYALQQLRKNPDFTAVAVLTLALSIGALMTVAVWTNAILFDPWPQVRDVRSLRFIDATVLGGQGYSVHYDQLEFLRQNSHSFREGAALSGDDLNVYSANGEPQVVHGGISSNYFQTLAVQPELGRFFQPEVSKVAARPMGSGNSVVPSTARPCNDSLLQS